MSQGAYSCNSTASSKLARRSWADIVKRQDSAPTYTEVVDVSAEDIAQDPAPACTEVVDISAESTKQAGPPGIFAPATPLKPGTRGSLQCFCRGKVLSMLSYYGWLQVFGEVDHPLSKKHSGRIYLQKSDIAEGQALETGDIVSFYLYADNVGLGAEKCQLDQKEHAPMKGMSGDAAAFVPGGAFHSPEPVADMFARMSRTFESIPANGLVQMVGFNAAYFDDDSSDDDDDAESAVADKESLHEESGDSSGDDAKTMLSTRHESIVRSAPWKTLRAVSPDRSTNEGTTSDASLGITSESETEGTSLTLLRLPPGFRPPPGLTLPAGFCLPPEFVETA